MVLGVYAFFSPIVDLIGEIPFVGWWMRNTASAMIFLAAVIVCIPLFLGVLSIAWLIYRPKTGLIIFGFAIGFVIVLVALDQIYK